MNTMTAQKLRVYLVEDTVDLREELIFGLTALGLDVSGFGDAAGLYRAMAIKGCDVVVIDVGLPGESGFSIAEHLRSNESIGLVIFTSHAKIEDRLHGLGLGADAYLIKPIDVRELAATLHAIYRRVKAKAKVALPDNSPPVVQDRRAVAPCWNLSADGWLLRNPQGRELVINEAERCLLKVVVEAAGSVVDHEAILAALAADDYDYGMHRLETVVSRLRKRTEQSELGSLPLKSVRGTGYIFTR
jgi:two-component system, OmpR family, response regulator PhoP